MRRTPWYLAVLVAASVALLGGSQAAPRPDAYAAQVAGIDLERATVLDLQDAMGAGRLSAVALTEYYLGRIEALNPRLRAVIETNPDAVQQARASDAHRRERVPRSPLEGIPVLLKDNIDTADRQHTTAGSLALVSSTPARDAFLVGKLRAAGAVLLGKANLSEWANFRSLRSSSGWSARGGQNANPYVLDRNPCGSSSGSAVAAAANLAAVTLGTETDGSIMCPAGANGVVGMKPTLGLVSRSGVVPISAQQDTAGPITRNVTDAAVVLSVIQGADPLDPATAGAGAYATRDHPRELHRSALRGKRIGVWQGAGSNVESLRALDTARARLRRLGATVVEDVHLGDLNRMVDDSYAALLVEFKHDLNRYLAARPGPHPGDLAGLIAFNREHDDKELRHFGQEILEAAERTSGDVSDPAYRAVRAAATDAARTAIDSALQAGRLDAILAPTNAPAWRTDLANGDDLTAAVGSATPAAVAGYPNITVPVWGPEAELPVGVSLFGTRWSDSAVLSMAYALESGPGLRLPPRYLAR